jgi:hypothetical protein
LTFWSGQRHTNLKEEILKTSEVQLLAVKRTKFKILPYPADVAELADALGSGSSGGDTVGVRLPSSASYEKAISHEIGLIFLFYGVNAARGLFPGGYFLPALGKVHVNAF